MLIVGVLGFGGRGFHVDIIGVELVAFVLRIGFLYNCEKGRSSILGLCTGSYFYLFPPAALRISVTSWVSWFSAAAAGHGVLIFGGSGASERSESVSGRALVFEMFSGLFPESLGLLGPEIDRVSCGIGIDASN
jgi:hypothetical protein